jgi:hypothetical protein
MWNPDFHGARHAALNIQGRSELLPPKPGETPPRYDTLEFKIVQSYVNGQEVNRIVCEGVVVDPPKRRARHLTAGTAMTITQSDTAKLIVRLLSLDRFRRRNGKALIVFLQLTQRNEEDAFRDHLNIPSGSRIVFKARGLARQGYARSAWASMQKQATQARLDVPCWHF